MPVSRITNTILGPTGTPLNEVAVTAKLMPQGSFRIDTFTEIARIVSTVTNSSGIWTLDLEEQANINPADTTWYEITEHIPDALGGRRVWNISVGASDQTLYASLVTPSYSNPVIISSDQVTYLTQQSADARYQALGGLGADNPTTIDPDDAAAPGVSGSASRQDHQHPIAAAVPVAVGAALAEGVSASFSRADHVHTGPLGTLSGGYAQIVASQLGIGAADTDLTNQAVTVTVASGRRIRITAYGSIANDGTAGAAALKIKEGATTLQDKATQIPASEFRPISVSVVLTPSAGVHTYKLTLVKFIGAGTVDWAAGATQPAYILAEDIGT